jgi:hypothetical protein
MLSKKQIKEKAQDELLNCLQTVPFIESEETGRRLNEMGHNSTDITESEAEQIAEEMRVQAKRIAKLFNWHKYELMD